MKVWGTHGYIKNHTKISRPKYLLDEQIELHKVMAPNTGGDNWCVDQRPENSTTWFSLSFQSTACNPPLKSGHGPDLWILALEPFPATTSQLTSVALLSNLISAAPSRHLSGSLSYLIQVFLGPLWRPLELC